jgi:hypothetical protein
VAWAHKWKRTAHVCRLLIPELRQLRSEVKVSRALLRKESLKAGPPRGWKRSQMLSISLGKELP